MSDTATAPTKPRVILRRYPNRRYYDCTRSQHMTLEDIYRLVQDGYYVSVTDSKSGEDITARVLAQLILEHDPPKLVAFPADLLHQIIRSNESLLRDFVDKYFNRALTAFLKSQRDFDQYLGHALGLYALPSTISRGWAEMMMGPFLQALAPGATTTEKPAAQPDEGTARQPTQEDSDLRKTVEELKHELDVLRQELEKRGTA